MEELAELDGVFGWGLFPIYEMVQYNAVVRCLFLVVDLGSRK